MLMDGAQVEQALPRGEALSAQPSLCKWPTSPEEQEAAAQESYRSQVSQARDSPKQNLAPQKRGIKNWDSLFREPSMRSHTLDSKGQQSPLRPKFSAMSRGVIVSQAKGLGLPQLPPRATVQPFPGSNPSSLPPEDNCSIGWASKRRFSSSYSPLAVAMPSSCLPAPSP